VRLVRRPAESPDEVQRLANFEPLDPSILAGSKAVINLCGASIGRLPWTPAYATKLRRSRLRPTRVLADALRALGSDAPAFVSASALLAGPDVRVTLLRTAPLAHADGVLKPLLRLTKLGVSGPLGSGRQVMPWISLDDEVRAIRHVIDTGLTGPVNLAGPTPATSNDLGRELAQRLRRPYALPVPKWGLRAALGRRAADSLLLADADVQPTRLVESGFEFTHPTVADAVAAAVPARR
jgi:NAD dependent epimerase/dehydratase family enzyme